MVKETIPVAYNVSIVQNDLRKLFAGNYPKHITYEEWARIYNKFHPDAKPLPLP